MCAQDISPSNPSNYSYRVCTGDVVDDRRINAVCSSLQIFPRPLDFHLRYSRGFEPLSNDDDSM